MRGIVGCIALVWTVSAWSAGIQEDAGNGFAGRVRTELEALQRAFPRQVWIQSLQVHPGQGARLSLQFTGFALHEGQIHQLREGLQSRLAPERLEVRPRRMKQPSDAQIALHGFVAQMDIQSGAAGLSRQGELGIFEALAQRSVRIERLEIRRPAEFGDGDSLMEVSIQAQAGSLDALNSFARRLRESGIFSELEVLFDPAGGTPRMTAHWQTDFAALMTGVGAERN